MKSNQRIPIESIFSRMPDNREMTRRISPLSTCQVTDITHHLFIVCFFRKTEENLISLTENRCNRRCFCQTTMTSFISLYFDTFLNITTSVSASKYPSIDVGLESVSLFLAFSLDLYHPHLSLHGHTNIQKNLFSL